MSEPRDDADDNPIDLIAAEFVNRLREGEHPSVEEYATLYPDIAEDIRELLPAVVAMEELKLQREQVDKSRFLKGPSSLTRLDDFLILGEIGRGGMGIVYEAEQESLGRRVAVKVLPRQFLLDDRKLERFDREAQTAARLHHTNIVPVFGVGEQDGYHYYVMQFIRGIGLDRVLLELRGEGDKPGHEGREGNMRQLAVEAASALRQDKGRAPESQNDLGSEIRSGRSYWLSVARVGAQVADALSYAHSQGTLHRDIKPANLLLDGDGVIWVTDFGLAKAIEGSHLTHTGDVVGTLQYMAPEQFCGNYDERSEIYCLGLTLYELLTLQPAFAGSNRSGLIQKVTQGNPVRPRRTRPDIPEDLETIILKAISREAKHRYQTAEDLHEDLHRYLEDLPILARRTSPAQRLTRWCRRNKALASAVFVAIFAVLTGTTIGWVFYVKESTKSLEAITAREQTKENLDHTLETLTAIFDSLAGTNVYQPMILDTSNNYQEIIVPVASRKDTEVLGTILEFYDDISAQIESEDSAALAHRRIADLYLRLGQLEKAQDAYLETIIRYRILGEEHYKVEIAACRNQLGQVHAKLDLLDEARASHEHVLASLEMDEGLARDSDFELARAHDLLGTWGPSTVEEDAPRPGRGRRGRRQEWTVPFGEERRNHHEKAQAILLRLLRGAPQDPAIRLAYARNCRNYSNLISTRNPQQSRRLRSQAIDFLKDLATQYGGVLQYRYELAESLAIEPDPGDLDEALEICRELRDQDAFVPSYTELMSRVLIAMSEFPEAITLLEILVSEWPENRSYKSRLASALLNYTGSGNLEISERRSQVERAIEILDSITADLQDDEHPRIWTYRSDLADARIELSNFVELILATDQLRQATALLEQIAEGQPGQLSYYKKLADTRVEYTRNLLQLEDTTTASEMADRLDEDLSILVQALLEREQETELRNSDEYDDLADWYSNLGLFFMHLGRQDDSRAAYQQEARLRT